MTGQHPEPAEPTEAQLSPLADDYRNISVRRWLAVFALLVIGCVAALAVLLRTEPLSLESWEVFKASVTSAGPAVKMLIFAVYLMFSCTFLPMNTGWLVSAVAMEELSVTGELWSTVLLVSVVGSAASTVANLNDYHLFTLMLRSERIARIRHTRIYHIAARWFDRAPFAILFIFNLLPIPVDVARMLAAIHRYPRLPFAVANFTGRACRYAIIAYVTYSLANRGWIAAAALLALALVLAAGRLAISLLSSRTRGCKAPTLHSAEEKNRRGS